MNEIKLTEVIDEIDDILSSGCCDEISDFMEKELTELANSLAPEEKKAVFEEYVNSLDLDYILEGEVGLMELLFGQGAKIKATVSH